MAKRVTAVQLHVEYQETQAHRVSQLMLMVEVEELFGLFPYSIESAEAFGVPDVSQPATISDTGNIASAEAFGIPVVTRIFAQEISSVGEIVSGEAFGIAVVSVIDPPVYSHGPVWQMMG